MKILESQSALLTNYEVYEHLRARYAQPGKKRRGPPNLRNVVSEVGAGMHFDSRLLQADMPPKVLTHLETFPGPMSEQPNLYSPETIALLLERLAPYDLTKGEIFMILNIRPTAPSAFSPIIENWCTHCSMPPEDRQPCDDRFNTPEIQEALVKIVTEVLGKFDDPPDAAEGEDESHEQRD